MLEEYNIEVLRKAQRSLANMDCKRALVFCFVLGFVVRLVPEILSYPYPIGFDTVYYAAKIKSGVVWDHLGLVFSSWLLYGILISIYRIVQIDPFLLLKFMAPLLYALNVSGMYYFAKKALNWETRKALWAAFFFAFQLGALRISWDLHRNMLGMALLLFTMPLLPETKSRKKLSLFIVLSILIVLGHELISVILFVLAFAYMASSFVKKEKAEVLRTAIAVSPALLVFLISVYFLMLSPRFPFFPNVIDSEPYQNSGISFFLINYLDAKASVVLVWAYLDLVSNVFLFSIILYVLFIPLIVIGLFRNWFLDRWTLFLVIGSFNPLITPFAALPLWWRWMFMLAYPFTFYIANGFERVLSSRNDTIRPSFRVLGWMKISRRIGVGILILMMVIALFFMTIRYDNYETHVVSTTSSNFPPFPPTMLQNTIPLQDVNNVVEAFEWLDGIMEDKSGVIVHQVFIPWALLYLKSTRTITRSATDFGKAWDLSVQNERNPIYLIWWNENIGWFDLAIPKNFKAVFSSGRISIFRNR